MGEAKPWQIAVIVVGLLTLVGMVVWQCARSDVQLATSITVVDVESGQVFETPLPRNRAVRFPALNPDTNRKTLVPASQDPGSGWTISERYIPVVAKMEFNKDIVDAKTGSFKAKGDPVSKNLFKR